MSSLPIVPVAAARRFLMGSQGLLADPTRRATTASLQRQIEAMGFVQIDTISAVERAHHHILASRLDGYRPAQFARLLEDRRSLFEHWTHDASAIPIHWFPHWKPRFRRYDRPTDPWGRWLRRRTRPSPRQVIAHVRERIEREGPLMSRDFENVRPKRGQGWWDWKPQKKALEYLWRTGELAVAGRVNFQKVYDLTSRCLPEAAATEEPSPESHCEWACTEALGRLGFGTPKEIQHFFEAVPLADAKRWCKAAVDSGAVIEVLLESADGTAPRRVLALPDWERRVKRLPEPPTRMRLLSPFDPVIRDRARAQRLFGFEYTFEAFVPAPKRRYGYYILPILDGDRLVGRMDPKFHRDRGCLEVRQVWWEPRGRKTRARSKALVDATERFAEQIGAERCELPTAGKMS